MNGMVEVLHHQLEQDYKQQLNASLNQDYFLSHR
jgi:hypothetical protein